MLPIFNIFELGVKEIEKNAYVAVGKNNITKSVLNDEGTLGIYLVQEKENPNMTYMFEVYEDEKSYQEHVKSEQYKEFLRQSPTILTNHKKKIQVMPEYMRDKKFVQTRNTRVNYVTVYVKEGFNNVFREIVLDEMKILGGKYLATIPKIATAWAIAKGTIPIIGVTKPNQVDDAERAASVELSAEDVELMDRVAISTGVTVKGEWESSM
jgi:antibiotic biosynthesis monooxygenase